MWTVVISTFKDYLNILHIGTPFLNTPGTTVVDLVAVRSGITPLRWIERTWVGLGQTVPTTTVAGRTDHLEMAAAPRNNEP
jgi:hypothetical protein